LPASLLRNEAADWKLTFHDYLVGSNPNSFDRRSALDRFIQDDFVLEQKGFDHWGRILTGRNTPL